MIQRVRVTVIPYVMNREPNKLSNSEFIDILSTHLYNGKIIAKVIDQGTDQLLSYKHYYDLILVDDPAELENGTICINTTNISVDMIKKAKYVVIKPDDIDISKFTKKFIARRYHLDVKEDFSGCDLVI